MLKKCFFLWVFFLGVYLLVSSRGTLRWDTTAKNYFSLQAYSLVRGHINLIALPQDLYDLSIYNHQAFLYWPPLPSFFALPFVILGGINVSDILYTAFYASFCPVILYLLLHQAKKVKYIPSISENQILLLTLFFAFGTVFFYLSVVGTVWFTSQVISTIPLLVSLLFLFKYIEDKTNISFIISVIFLCLAFWGRNTLILTGLLHLFILFTVYQNRIKLVLISLLIIITCISLFGLYNYIRFGSLLENGLKYHQVNPKWKNDLSNYGVLNPHYLPYNFFYLLINPVGITRISPYINPDPEGNSIFSTSPLLLLFFGLFSFNIWKKENKPLIIYLLISGIILFSLLVYFSTGWIQFGYRYALDAIPLLILSLSFFLEQFPASFNYILLASSIIINSLGVYWMLNLLYNL